MGPLRTQEWVITVSDMAKAPFPTPPTLGAKSLVCFLGMAEATITQKSVF